METINVLINGNQFYASADQALLPYAQLLFGALKNIPEQSIRDGYRIEIGFLSLLVCRWRAATGSWHPTIRMIPSVTPPRI